MNRLLLLSLFGCYTTFSAHAGLLAHYPFDDDFNDASGNARHLVVGAGTTASGEQVFGGGALDLEKVSNEFLSLDPEINFTITDAWSVSFWARRRPGAADATGLIVGDNTTTDSFIWLPDTARRFRRFVSAPSGSGRPPTTTTPRGTVPISTTGGRW